MRNYLSAIKEFDYQHTMESALAGSLSAVSYTHLTLPTKA